MKSDTHVYCTHCLYFRLEDEDKPYCPYEDKCDIWNCEDSKPYSERPMYEKMRQMSVISYEEILQAFRKLGYTEEEIKELEEVSKWYDPMLPIDAESASQFLQEAMNEYMNRR